MSTSIRRVLTVLGLMSALITGASLPATAGFADSAAVPTTTIATGTVAAPATLTVDDYCMTTTTTTRRTVYTDPVTGVQTQTSYSSTSSTTTNTWNEQSYSSSTVAGPGVNETTTTTVSKNTNLHVNAGWTASASRGVNGYLVSAHLVDGSVYPMAQNATTVLTTSGAVDADYIAYQPRLSVTTLTTYGWTATTAPSRVLTC